MQEKKSHHANISSQIIDNIKSHLGFKTDAQLADYFGVKPNTISTWRERNSVPNNHLIAKRDELNLGEILNHEKAMPTNKKDINQKDDLHDEDYQVFLTAEKMMARRRAMYEDIKKIDETIEDHDRRLKIQAIKIKRVVGVILAIRENMPSIEKEVQLLLESENTA